jgi:competence protein ComFC
MGSYICANCFTYIKFHEAGICIVCQRQAIGGLTHPVCKNKYSPDGVFSSLVYTGVVKKLVYKFKYNPNLTDLKTTLTDLFYEGLIQKEAFYKVNTKDSILVPIPLFKGKFRIRGYNQSEILANSLAKKLDLKVLNILERVRDTKTQVGLKKEERETNIKGAFVIKREFIEKVKTAKQVFLIDDVVTSGATLKEAAKVLKKAGVGKVYCITLAHGQ